MCFIWLCSIKSHSKEAFKINNSKLRDIIAAIDDKNGTDIKVLDISKLTSETDLFILATGRSTRNTMAIADEIEYRLKQKGFQPGHLEGHRKGSWILMDYGDVVVHVFTREERDFYDLERLWSGSNALDVDRLRQNL